MAATAERARKRCSWKYDTGKRCSNSIWELPVETGLCELHLRFTVAQTGVAREAREAWESQRRRLREEIAECALDYVMNVQDVRRAELFDVLEAKVREYLAHERARP